MSPRPPIDRALEIEHLYQPEGWLDGAFVGVAEDGTIAGVHDQRPAHWPANAVKIRGFVVPGIPNVHSHAFQRALVGHAEVASPERDDSFWTWRVAMYELALRLLPEHLEAIAAQLYVELLEGGFTSVGEFHYLHRDPDGRPYANPNEMGARIQAAADATGIALTHLPVLYLQGGFGAAPKLEQRRFVHSNVDDYLATASAFRPAGRTVLGAAPHSLRAVGPEALASLVRAASGPLHIHIAEQEREVKEATVHLGARPVRWLLDNAEVGPRWCLVHATWCDDGELAALASSGAVAGLCPTTEANLGDGVFGAQTFLAAGGSLAIGTDSHVGVDPAEELRLLELVQRLVHRRRNVLCGKGRHPARTLLDRAIVGGNQALGQPAGHLVAGKAADLVALRADHPRLVGHGPETILDAWVFGAGAGAVSDVFVAGRRVVKEGRHFARDEIGPRFAAAVGELWP